MVREIIEMINDRARWSNGRVPVVRGNGDTAFVAHFFPPSLATKHTFPAVSTNDMENTRKNPKAELKPRTEEVNVSRTSTAKIPGNIRDRTLGQSWLGEDTPSIVFFLLLPPNLRTLISSHPTEDTPIHVTYILRVCIGWAILVRQARRENTCCG